MIKNFHRPKQSGRAYRAPWYDTTRWRAERISYLSQYPLCVECDKAGRVEAATVVDHKVNISSLPKEQRQSMFWNQSNWQPLCKRCHNSKSAKERNK